MNSETPPLRALQLTAEFPPAIQHIIQTISNSIFPSSASPLQEIMLTQKFISFHKNGIKITDEIYEFAKTCNLTSSFLAKTIALLPADDTTLPPLKRKWRQNRKRLLEDQLNYRPSIDIQINEISIDNFRNELLPRILYSAENQPAPLKEILITATKIIGCEKFRLFNGKIATQGSLHSIIEEFFRNTHDHARCDLDGQTPINSIRAILIKFHPFTSTLRMAEEVSEEDKTAGDWFVFGFGQKSNNSNQQLDDRKNPTELLSTISLTDAFDPVRAGRVRALANKAKSQNKLSPAALQPVGFIEISVLDSGPGLPAKWLNHRDTEISTDTQIDALLACLSKGETSTGDPTRGFGLWKTLQAIKELYGLISIRTNNLHAARTYAIAPMRGSRTKEELDNAGKLPARLNDWSKPLSSALVRYDTTQGTAASVLLPLFTDDQ